jgi:hypothetical protein
MSLDQIIDYTNLFQDIELATAVGQLKQDPAQLQQFLQDQQGKIYNDIVSQKDSTFEKVYGDLNRASKAQEAVLMYEIRSKQLADLQKQIYENQKRSASAITEDKSLAGRKYEMNQWSVGNKNETLFIFSMLFIALSALVLITTLWRMGMISSALWVTLAAPIIIIFILVLINRSQFTNVFRDKRYWNRNTFNQKYGKIPVPLCPSLSDLQNDLSSFESDVESGIAGAAMGVAQGVQSAANTVSSATQSVANDIAQAAAPANIPSAAPITN